jgi:hypothetical protein
MSLYSPSLRQILSDQERRKKRYRYEQEGRKKGRQERKKMGRSKTKAFVIVIGWPR